MTGSKTFNKLIKTKIKINQFITKINKTFHMDNPYETTVLEGIVYIRKTCFNNKKGGLDSSLYNETILGTLNKDASGHFGRVTLNVSVLKDGNTIVTGNRIDILTSVPNNLITKKKFYNISNDSNTII